MLTKDWSVFLGEIGALNTIIDELELPHLSSLIIQFSSQRVQGLVAKFLNPFCLYFHLFNMIEPLVYNRSFPSIFSHRSLEPI